jgi:phosphatidylinositol alpha-1,6-mannosyltransferase
LTAAVLNSSQPKAIMRILLITDDYLPHRGGSRVYYHNLLLCLDGIERIVLTRARRGTAEFDRRQPYRVIRCHFREWPALRPLKLQFLPVYLRLFWSAMRTVFRHRPDVIVAGELVPTGPVAALLCMLFRKPLVLFTHAEAPATLSRTRGQSRLARWVCRRAQAIVVSSDYGKRKLTDLWRVPEDKITVLTPAVGEEHLDPAHVAAPCAHPDRPRRLLSVGRLVRRKGHLTVLQALPQVLREIPDLEYTIAGAGPLENELKATAARLGLQDKVRFLGVADPADLLREFAGSDCFVLPNADDPVTGDTEGFGIVFIEASGHGLPVIGGRTEGTEGAILDGETGLRIEGGDPRVVASAILHILKDPALARRYGKQGREFVLTQMRWPARAKRLLEIVEKITRRRLRTER